MKVENNLDTDKVRGLVWRLAFPSMLAQFVNVLYSIVDRMYIGNIEGIGALALAGVGICGPVVTLISSFASWIGVGGAPLMSIRLGQKNERAATQMVANCFALLTGMAVVIMTAGTILCWAVPGWLIGLFTTNPDTIVLGIDALRMISLGFIISAVSVTCQGALEGLGKGTPSLVISLARYLFLIIPAAFILSRVMQSANGVWLAFPVTEVIAAVISVLVYKRQHHDTEG